jgi:hypothetical protein
MTGWNLVESKKNLARRLREDDGTGQMQDDPYGSCIGKCHKLGSPDLLPKRGVQATCLLLNDFEFACETRHPSIIKPTTKSSYEDDLALYC